MTEFGKFRYDSVPLGICASGDIFQAKVDELIVDIKGVKTYIDNILVLVKVSLSHYIDQLRIIFARMLATGLDVNDPRCSFGFK